MSQAWFETIERYIEALFVPADPALEAAQAAAQAAGLPAIEIAPGHGKLLYLLARLVGARRILEIGTLAGYSAIWLARALPADGRLITLEYEPRHAAVARANLARAGLAERAEVRIGAALDSLPKLAAEGAGPFDLVFIDADKTGYVAYLDWAIRLARPGALIVADNVIRAGAVLDPSNADQSAAGAAAFNQALAAEPRVEAILLQQIGTKGHDGLALARVR
jgi:predicted O-methyltransferase YrrM